jgi:hypothetical protein
VAVGATLVRYVLNYQIAGCRLGQQTPPSNRKAVLLEEIWLLCCSTFLLGLSTWASEQHNARCGLVDQAGCFEGWPQQANSWQMIIVSATFVGWYAHGVTKSLVPGVALRSGAPLANSPAIAVPVCWRPASCWLHHCCPCT